MGGKQYYDGTDWKIVSATYPTGANIATTTSSFPDPLTTRGDVIIRNAANVTDRLPVGAAGEVLTSDGTDVAWAAGGGGASSTVPINTILIMDAVDIPAGLVGNPNVITNSATAIQDAVTALVTEGYAAGFDKGQILIYGVYNEPTEDVLISRPFDLTIQNMIGSEVVLHNVTLKLDTAESTFKSTLALRLTGNNNIATRIAASNGDPSEFIAFSIYGLILDYDSYAGATNVDFITNLNNTLVRASVSESGLVGTPNITSEFSCNNCMFYSTFTLSSLTRLMSAKNSRFNSGAYFWQAHYNTDFYVHVENCHFGKYSDIGLIFKTITTAGQPIRIKSSSIESGGRVGTYQTGGTMNFYLDHSSFTSFSAHAVLSTFGASLLRNPDENMEVIYYGTATSAARNPYLGMLMNVSGVLNVCSGLGPTVWQEVTLTPQHI